MSATEEQVSPAPAGQQGVDTLLRVDGVGVEFDGKWALRDVSLEFMPGQIHGLVGHNGSGKSTLVRVLAGYHRPATGSVSLGEPGALTHHSSPAHSQELGIRFVHQDLGLVSEFSALENFGLGGHYSRGRARSIDWSAQEDRLREVLATLQAEFPLRVPVSELSAVQRSLLAIARAVGGGEQGASATRFLVLDEPTTALERPEVEQLFEVVRKLSQSGVGVVYISHQLHDVLALCSKVSVLREGRVVESLPTTGTAHERLVRAMLGESTPLGHSASADRFVAADVDSRRREHPVLEVKGLRSTILRGTTFSLAAGECVCVVGLSGSGREELAYAIAGAVPSSADELRIKGQTVPDLTPVDALARRIALVPGNRLPGSIIPDFTVRENTTFASLETWRRGAGVVSRRAEREATNGWMERLDIRPRSCEYETRYLSGGNKQKVILAKWLSVEPLVMLVDEPTAGVDIGAARLISDTLRSLVLEGMSVLVTTSELEDAVALADRILVLNKGVVSHELVRGRDDFTEEAILSAMTERHQDSSLPAGDVAGAR